MADCQLKASGAPRALYGFHRGRSPWCTWVHDSVVQGMISRMRSKTWELWGSGCGVLGQAELGELIEGTERPSVGQGRCHHRAGGDDHPGHAQQVGEPSAAGGPRARSSALGQVRGDHDGHHRVSAMRMPRAWQARMRWLDGRPRHRGRRPRWCTG